MAMGFIFAVASDRKTAVLRQDRQQFKRMAVLRGRHLGPVLLQEDRPFGGRGRRLPLLDGLSARSEVGEPHVIPILGRELGLCYASRRPPHRSDARALALGPRGS